MSFHYDVYHNILKIFQLVKLHYDLFFQHIRNSHGALFPLRCGYCVFLGQDHNQLRHHIRKKHGTTKYHIIDIPRLLAEHDQPGVTIKYFISCSR